MIKVSFAVASLLAVALATPAEDYTLHTFKKIQVTDQFWSEGANFGDFNRDGKMDVVSGPYWWEGPQFTQRHEYDRPQPRTSPSGSAPFKKKLPDGTEQTIDGFEGVLGKNNSYSDNFFAFTYDFDQDGWTDILIYGFPGKDASWYENPQGKQGDWKRHIVWDVVDNESPWWFDLTGDGKPEIVCNSGGHFGYAVPNWSDPAAAWTFHKISPKGNWQRFTHGLGIGDVNGDGRMDVLEKDGWWEQPASLAGDPIWTKHEQNFGTGGAQMYAYDVNGDGLSDVITSLAAHGYGLAWYEQKKENGNVTFQEHIFMNKEPKENKYGVKFSQLHAIDLVDMDGDGLKDIITGKRFWAHGPTGDAEPNASAVLYWFKLVRNPDKTVDFMPYLIDDNSGIGTQVVVGDVNGDKWPDVVVGNKKGTFIHLHSAKNVSKEEWEKGQPKTYVPPPASASAK